jgi:hypothetical protein
MSNYDFSQEEQLVLTKIDFGIPKPRHANEADGVVEEFLAALMYKRNYLVR